MTTVGKGMHTSSLSPRDRNQYTPLQSVAREKVSPAADKKTDIKPSSLSSQDAWEPERRKREESSQSPRYSPRDVENVENVPSGILRAREQKEYRKKLSAARMVVGFAKRQVGYVTLDTDSVYGAAILMPQLARTAGWEKFLTFLAIRSWIFLFLNILVQGYAVYFVAMEERVMDDFAGQMFLCDFGVQVDVGSCPGGGSKCLGPGGTEVSLPRIYNWAQWSTRSYVRDSLKVLFPDRAEEIEAKVDPGEYGVEAYNCRLLCCFIFIVSVMNDLVHTLDMLRMLYRIPTTDEDWFEADDHVDNDTDVLSLDHVKVKIAGMPCLWKMLNVLFVVIPKFMIWKLLSESGIMFLMETSSIEDVIVNAVAMAFLLNIDEMLCAVLMSQESKTLLQKLEGTPLYDSDEWKNWSNDKILEEYEHHWKEKSELADFLALIPVKLIACFGLTFVFVFEYYARNCIRNGEGGFVSRPMYLPTSSNFGFLTAFFPNFFPLEKQDEAYWSMPEGQ